ARPFVLVHEGQNDLRLAEQLSAAVGGINIIRESGALEIKGILGACSGTLGSRFHGLVSALSQGVPALATGWSHKYQMLFEDYGFPDGLLQVTGDKAEIRRKLDLVTDQQEQVRTLIQTRAGQLKQQSQQMWQEVFALIDPIARNRQPPKSGAAGGPLARAPVGPNSFGRRAWHRSPYGRWHINRLQRRSRQKAETGKLQARQLRAGLCFAAARPAPGLQHRERHRYAADTTDRPGENNPTPAARRGYWPACRPRRPSGWVSDPAPVRSARQQRGSGKSPRTPATVGKPDVR